MSVVGRSQMQGLRFENVDEASAVQKRLYRAGVIAETCGGGAVLKLFPPITMTPDEWRELGDLIGDVILDAAPTSARLQAA